MLEKQKQNQTNLFTLDVFILSMAQSQKHALKIKLKSLRHNESNYDLLKLKPALSKKTKCLSIYPLFAFIWNTS